MRDNSGRPTIFTPERIRAADAETARWCAELDITNADHIALWLETNTDEPRSRWLAVQIAEAFERAIDRKCVSWGPGDPDCPPEIKTRSGELHTLRCKVCGQDIARVDTICFGKQDTHPTELLVQNRAGGR